MRRFFVPEVVQTSATDCGPASLTALLEGFRVSASYGRLREACFTGVDGTSIDQIEEAAIGLGLDAEQIIVPADHLLLDEAAALPALVVVRLPSGMTHFVIAWRRCGPWVQLMDPGSGRRWETAAEFVSDLYTHTQDVPADAWREWAGSPDFIKPLEARLRKLGIGPARRRRLIDIAVADVTPASLAATDAAVRLVASLAAEGAVDRGAALADLVANLTNHPATIPQEWWSAEFDSADPSRLRMRGAVLVRVKGVRVLDEGERSNLSPEFADALAERAPSPLSLLWQSLRDESISFHLALILALALAAGSVVCEAVVFRGIFDLGHSLALGPQRWWAIALLGVFFAAVTVLDYATTQITLRAGSRFESLMRLRFLTKIPRLADAYFRSRLISDMADRAHSAHRLHDVPPLIAAIARSVFGLVFTVAGIAWLYPESRIFAVAAGAIAVGIPLLAHPWLSERDLRARIHAGALNRFLLDALLGSCAVRAHGAARAITREHESLLREWAAAALSCGRSMVKIQTMQAAVCAALIAYVVYARVAAADDPGGLLLLVYWALAIPALGHDIATLACQYPRLRNTVLRLTEPLGVREEELLEDGASEHAGAGAVGITMAGVTVAAGGGTILEGIDVDIQAGEHIAIVGASGAGKSTLAGLLLGWSKPGTGELRVDGRVLDARGLADLRRKTAWISPQVHIWNRSLFENVEYGNTDPAAAFDRVLEEAELPSIIEKLPEGMQTKLGESGRLLSGGEGQRVRLGRGFRRTGVRLAILDEALRGLERERRRKLLEAARRRWKCATLLNITHDMAETWTFSRILVVEGGRIVEDGAPEDLYGRANSRYRALVDGEETAWQRVWCDRGWKRFRLEAGRLRPESATANVEKVREVAC